MFLTVFSNSSAARQLATLPCSQTLLSSRARLTEVLMDWDPLLKPNPCLVSLGFAFVRRLARDSRILVLQPEDLGSGTLQHKCLGCPSCCGPIWKFKTEAVATLYAMFCEFRRFANRLHHLRARQQLSSLECTIKNIM